MGSSGNTLRWRVVGGFAGEFSQQEYCEEQGEQVGQKAKWKHNAVTAKASANPVESFGAGVAFQVCSKLRQRGQAFVSLHQLVCGGCYPRGGGIKFSQLRTSWSHQQWGDECPGPDEKNLGGIPQHLRQPQTASVDTSCPGVIITSLDDRFCCHSIMPLPCLPLL